MKRFLFLAFTLTALIAFSSNAPPCDMGTEQMVQCNYDVGTNSQTFADAAVAIFENYTLAEMPLFEFSNFAYQYHADAVLMHNYTYDVLRNQRDVDCSFPLFGIVTTSTFNLMSISDYTELGYSIWN